LRRSNLMPAACFLLETVISQGYRHGYLTLRFYMA
jgi:hypothetical protein